VLETAVLGSAIVAAAGIGAHDDARRAIAAMTRIDRVIEPDAANRARYDELFATYTALYPALKSVRHPAAARSGALAEAAR
jgi:sugar (pentulose or hexulose) kinase